MPEMKRSLLGLPALAPGAADDAADQKGTVQFAYIENDFDMPDLWFGYEAADVVVLVTRQREIHQRPQLGQSAPRAARLSPNGCAAAASSSSRSALRPNMRRRRAGSRQDAAARRRQNAAHQLPDRRQRDLPRNDQPGPLGRPQRPCSAGATQRRNPSTDSGRRRDRPRQRLRKVGDKTQECPVVVEASCGLGRVWMTAFDLDGPPFKTWTEGQKAFWNKVQTEFTPKAELAARPPQQAAPTAWTPNEPPALLAELQRSLENFEQRACRQLRLGGAVHPHLHPHRRPARLHSSHARLQTSRTDLDHLPGRRRSASAFSSTASPTAMKGDDLRINKIDLVEYDLSTPPQAGLRARRWFTLFSPRIQNYTVGVEPSAPGWAVGAARRRDRASPSTVAALANPDLGRRASVRPACSASPTPTPRTPPAWSTCRSPSGPLAPSRRPGAPAVDPDQASRSGRRSRHAARPRPDANDRGKLIGEITNQSARRIAERDAVLPGQLSTRSPTWRPARTSTSRRCWRRSPARSSPARPSPVDGRRRSALAPSGADAQSDVRQRFTATSPSKQPYESDEGPAVPRQGDGRPDEQQRPAPLRRELAAGREADGRAGPAAGRAAYRDEVILVAPDADPVRPGRSGLRRTPAPPRGSGSTVCPTANRSRPALSGYLRQETYVRVYIPCNLPK